MLDRKKPPQFVQNKSFDLLIPEIQNLGKSGKFVCINSGEQELIRIELVFYAGRWHEKFPGISHFTSTLLPKGTTRHTCSQITNTFDLYGVHLQIHPGFDFTTVSLIGLTKNIPLVLDLLIDVISDPIFPENELQQAIEIFKQGLKINLEKTSFIASREFRKILFGQAHPYGYDIELSNLNNIHKNKLTQFHQSSFSDVNVFVSGKINDKTKTLIFDKLSQLKSQTVNPIQHNPSPSNTQENHITKEGAVQTSLRIGKLSINRYHPDYPGLLLLNHLLGGFFGSRLMKNIREEKGLTYGIHSSIHPLQHYSYLVIGADVNRENKQLVISEILNELNRFKNSTVTYEELELARNHFIGSLQAEMSTPFAHADKIKSMTLFNLPNNYYQQLFDSIFKITDHQIIELANQHLSESQIHTVSIG